MKNKLTKGRIVTMIVNGLLFQKGRMKRCLYVYISVSPLITLKERSNFHSHVNVMLLNLVGSYFRFQHDKCKNFGDESNASAFYQIM